MLQIYSSAADAAIFPSISGGSFIYAVNGDACIRTAVKTGVNVDS